MLMLMTPVYGITKMLCVCFSLSLPSFFSYMHVCIASGWLVDFYRAGVCHISLDDKHSIRDDDDGDYDDCISFDCFNTLAPETRL